MESPNFEHPHLENVIMLICSRMNNHNIENVIVGFDDYQIAGKHTISWDASGISSGVYFPTLLSDKIKVSKKIMLVK